MDFLFENLGPERFQEFCSCLLLKEFPEFQSFPVGQRDGGRDSLSYINSKKNEFIVYQVKFVRNPKELKDIHKWLTKIIDDESPKINKLIPKGAKKYYLLTNVNGTSYLDSGSIDMVDKIFKEKITIPAFCWWRDDLCRRFEVDPIFKWSFPEIINGQDLLNSILFEYINDNKERRESTIRNYIIDQYKIDDEVKFKQIELRNKLFTLYTDLPIRLNASNNKKNIMYINNLMRVFQFYEHSIDDYHQFEDELKLCGASFLLHPKVQNKINKVLLEGAPGQGKSTISQFICQVHRVKLLDKSQDLELLPEKYKTVPVRLPFKIDLRDIASWVKHQNPYPIRISDIIFENIWKKTLESFITSHIIYHSQMDQFNISDLHSILNNSSVLFVFDGFDEIAKIEIRKEVVDFINKGLSRLEESSKSIQVIITSRPAAFSNSVGFSNDIYYHFELEDINKSIIKEYVERWINSSKINVNEANTIKKLLDEKIEMPHLRDLTKNPMQLAIFISLLRTRGESLPNKRTALYDNYIELFFNRESEKSSLVRDNRDLIIDIHQYLAWLLHSEAEMYNNSGRIDIEDLKSILKQYLENEGHKTDITDLLFDVMKERVCAIVSRIQGTFEFEVQPLREYFCAKFLYNTSPYSPAGCALNGTKPERFEAIAKNLYWNNVVRFFAGCFDKGELPMLILKLNELQEDELLKNTNYPSILTSQLLSDWVFTQYPKLMKEVVKIIVNKINTGNLLNFDGEYQNKNFTIQLPPECGRNEIVDEAFHQLFKIPSNDYAIELITLLNKNRNNNLELWKYYFYMIKNENKRTIWLTYAYHLQILHKLDDELLLTLIQIEDENEKIKRLQTIINGNKNTIVDSNLEMKKLCLDYILNNQLHMISIKNNIKSLQILSYIIHPYLLSRVFDDDKSGGRFIDHIFYRYTYNEIEKDKIFNINCKDDIDKQISKIVDCINTPLSEDLSMWQRCVKNWDLLVNGISEQFGQGWSLKIIAVISAAIKSNKETYLDFEDLHNNSLSLCKRVRCARMKSGNINYWLNLLNKESDILFTLLVFFTWATPKTICSLIENCDDIIKKLSRTEYIKLDMGLKAASDISKYTRIQMKYLLDKLKNKDLSDELKNILSIRFAENERDTYLYNNIKTSNNKITDLERYKYYYLMRKFDEENFNADNLEEIKEIYQNNDIEYLHIRRRYGNVRVREKFSMEVANYIMDNATKFPREIVYRAEFSCRLYASKNVSPVGKIAEKGGWFL